MSPERDQWLWWESRLCRDVTWLLPPPPPQSAALLQYHSIADTQNVTYYDYLARSPAAQNSVSVCLSICLSARVSQQNTMSELHEIFCTCYL